MTKFLVSVPFSLHVTVEAENSDAISEDMVEDALLDQYGKYAEIDVRHGGGFFDVLEEVEEGGYLTPGGLIVAGSDTEPAPADDNP